MLGYSRYFQPSLWCVVGVLTLSGLLLAPGVFELRLEWAVPVHLPSGWRIPVAALHALGATVAAFVVGMLWPLHVRSGLRKRSQLGTGFALLSGLGVLALTGLGIYYFGNESLSAAASVIHVGVALLVIVFLTVHVICGRALRQRDR